MIQRILHGYKLAEAKNQIPTGLAVKATMATILEAGCVAFYKGYFGETVWAAEAAALRKERASAPGKSTDETACVLQESLLVDVTRVTRTLREANTTTDFPILLQNLRNRIVHDSYNPITETVLLDVATKRTVTDFKQIKGVRVDNFDRLIARPEGTDVEYAKFGYTEDGYQVVNYELAFGFTWEMWKNDDLSLLEIAMLNLGKAARRSRSMVVLEAILSGLAPTTVGTPGGPTIARLDQLITEEFGQENDDQGKPMGVSLTDIAFPTTWKTAALASLNSQNVLGPTTASTPEANPVYGCATPHEERLMRAVLGSDWLAWDNNVSWLEFAVLDDFQRGPRTYTQLPDVNGENVDQGSFSNHSLAIKLGDAFGAKVTTDKGVRRVKGA